MYGLTFELTERCNLNCIWCCAGKKHGSKELSYSDVVLAIDKFKPRRVCFSGGEPLLHKDLFKLIDYCKSKKIWTMIFTNGTLITPSIAKKLGVDLITISADGLEKTHDKIRGAGNFKRTLKGINNLIVAGKSRKIELLCTLGRENQHEAPKIVNYFYPKIRKFMFNRVLPVNKCDASQVLSRVDALKILLSLVKHRFNLSIRIRFGGCEFGSFFDIQQVVPAVLPDGNILQCQAQRSKILGNIHSTKRIKNKYCLFAISGCTECLLSKHNSKLREYQRTIAD